MGAYGEHKTKKRRFDKDEAPQSTFKPSVRFHPTQPREWTVSVAVPTSIIADCTTNEQRTVNVGRVARALAVFSIDEVVIFDDMPTDQRIEHVNRDGYTGETDPAHFMSHLLGYLEAPPFMRKLLFPLHPNLRAQGLLPSLDMPHHPHRDEWLPYREGITLSGKTKTGKGTLVDVGLRDLVTITDFIPPNTRLTLHYPEDPPSTTPPVPVHPESPRTEAGYFWGFSVRKCSSLSAVLTESPHPEGYDVSIGTSERGLPVHQAFPSLTPTSTNTTLDFQHLIIVFGGPRGLEYAAMNDSELAGMGIQGGKTRELFDQWVNVLPGQGSRTIRTEEAMFIALTTLRGLWE